MKPMLAGILVAVLVAFDQLSKWVTVANLDLFETVRLLPFLSLHHTRNFGIAFSLFDGLGQWPLVALACGVLVVVGVLWSQVPAGRWLSHWGFALIVAGALGNVIDRMWLGYVVDMISFHIDSIDFQFAVFNLADTWISLGALAVVLDELLAWLRERRAASASDG